MEQEELLSENGFKERKPINTIRVLYRSKHIWWYSVCEWEDSDVTGITVLSESKI